jgi:hypothetical protein
MLSIFDSNTISRAKFEQIVMIESVDLKLDHYIYSIRNWSKSHSLWFDQS